MTQEKAVQAAAMLVEARRHGQRIEGFPEDLRPNDLAEAYAIQAASLDGILVSGGGGSAVGYKIGCTNETAQAQLGLDEPFAGVLMSPFLHASPATLAADDLFMRVLEPEIAFRLGEDLAPDDAPYDAASVKPAIATVMGAIEVVDSRYAEWTTIGGLHLVADNAAAGHWVYGGESSDVAAIDYARHPVVLSLNGEVRERGVAGNALGSSLNALAWLANDMAKRGQGLSAGQLVTTGTTTAVVPAEAGDLAVADFGPLGEVSVKFE